MHRTLLLTHAQSGQMPSPSYTGHHSTDTRILCLSPSYSCCDVARTSLRIMSNRPIFKWTHQYVHRSTYCHTATSNRRYSSQQYQCIQCSDTRGRITTRFRECHTTIRRGIRRRHTHRTRTLSYGRIPKTYTLRYTRSHHSWSPHSRDTRTSCAHSSQKEQTQTKLTLGDKQHV